MDEKIIIQSTHYDVKKFFKAMIIIGVALSLLFTIFMISTGIGDYNNNYGTGHEHERWCYKWEYRDEYYDDEWDGNLQEYKMDCPQVVYGNAVSYAFGTYFGGCILMTLLIVGFFTLVGGIIYRGLRSYEMTVTDKRIYGKVAWGKRVDLPVDSVSAVSTSSMKGLAVATSSGKIAFKLIKNYEAIHAEISKLIIERQKAKAETPSANNVPAASNADELKKYKDLLDSGIITQEEFDAKKKQLLGL